MKPVALLVILIVVMVALFAGGPVRAAEDDERHYHVAYHAEFVPDERLARIRIRVAQQGGELRVLDFVMPKAVYPDVEADGRLVRDGDRVLWSVPAEGGAITFATAVDHARGRRIGCSEHPCEPAVYDARMTGDWALLRLDDLFPPARARRLVGSTGTSTMTLAGPGGWSFESRYGPVGDGVPVTDPRRRFDRPTGWLVAGRLGIRRDKISLRKVAVAAPVGQDVRRQDLLGFLRWTLPNLVGVFPEFPDRLLIVSARDQMWRGGLSGPASLYLHADRPYVSENGTSTVLHELVHVAMGGRFEGAADWIVEGLAEYYALEVLRRSGGISNDRFRRSLADLEEWSDEEDGELRDPSYGPHTAHAVLMFHELARELDKADSSLDVLVSRLADVERADLDTLKRFATEELGRPARALRD